MLNKNLSHWTENLINKGKYNRMGPSAEEPHWGLHLQEDCYTSQCTQMYIMNDICKGITMGNSWTAIMVTQ